MILSVWATFCSTSWKVTCHGKTCGQTTRSRNTKRSWTRSWAFLYQNYAWTFPTSSRSFFDIRVACSSNKLQTMITWSGCLGNWWRKRNSRWITNIAGVVWRRKSMTSQKTKNRIMTEINDKKQLNSITILQLQRNYFFKTIYQLVICSSQKLLNRFTKYFSIEGLKL